MGRGLLSADGRLALSGAINGTVCLWDVESGEVIRRFVGHSSGVRRVALSPAARFAVTCSQDEIVIVWDVATGEDMRRFLGHRGEVMDVWVAPGGRTVFSSRR